MALFLPHEPAVSWAGYWYNQLYVVLGNIVGGGVFVGGLYWLASPYTVPQTSVNDLPRVLAAPAMRSL